MIISKFIDCWGDIAVILRVYIYIHISQIYLWKIALKLPFIIIYPMDFPMAFPKEIPPTKGCSGCLGMVNPNPPTSGYRVRSLRLILP